CQTDKCKEDVTGLTGDRRVQDRLKFQCKMEVHTASTDIPVNWSSVTDRVDGRASEGRWIHHQLSAEDWPWSVRELNVLRG
ncbi:hypothetical protein BaRGS_00012245, partial [Batillaria attramentaria]